MSTQRRPRRLLAACHRCHSHKIRCSGDQPCRPCVASENASDCRFPAKERKIPISESYLRRLEEDSKRLQNVTVNHRHQVQQQNQDVLQTPESQQNTPGPGPGTRSDTRSHGNSVDDDTLRLSSEESNMLNPLFDGQPDNLASHDPSSVSPGYELSFIGEASCAAFSNRLLQCLDDTYTPSTAGFSNYHRVQVPATPSSPEYAQLHRTGGFPERMHAKLLLNVARRFIGNYHPLFLEVTFMRELDAVYRRELVPSTLWLCKFFALMALGEIYTNRRGVGDNRVPGTGYYERAVHMLQDHNSYEEPSLMQVEVLTLLAWASNILGRIRTAYCYSGTAVRLALSMGMHRAAANSRSSTLTPVERESRRRTWWVLYFFDRFSASKLGHPITVRDEDMDVEMPSMDGLTEEEKAEFLDPLPLVTNTKLGRIIGNILTDIYGIPKSTKGLCIHRVHGILKQLRAWHDELPPELRVKERGTPRPVASLHLAYNQCIIQTTRPVLLHLFKTQFQLGGSAPGKKSTEQEQSQTESQRQGQQQQKQNQPRRFSSITLALAESCVNAAQSSSRIVEGLFLDGSIASFGYWDAHHIFSAALILVMSTVMKPATATAEALEMLLSILRSMKNDGNIPAVDFCERLSHMQTRVSSLRERGQIVEGYVFGYGGDRGDGDGTVGAGVEGREQQQQHQQQQQQQQQQLQGQIYTVDDVEGEPQVGGTATAKDGTTASFPMPTSMQDAQGDEGNLSYGSADILGNPLIGSFLDESRMPWPDVLYCEDGTLKQFASEIEEQFLFQV